MASNCSSERKNLVFLTLNRKLEMIKLSEENMLKTKTGQKLGVLHQIVNQVINSRGKFLMEIKSAAPVNTQMIRKQNRLNADVITFE